MHKDSSMIVFIGVDGAGKTALSKAISSDLQFEYTWKRNFALFNRIINLFARFTGHNMKERINGQLVGVHRYDNFWKYVVFIFFVVDCILWCVYFALWRHKSKVCDRSFPDYVIDIAVSTKSPRIIFCVAFFPLKLFFTRNNVYFLDCNRKIMLNRRIDIGLDDQRFLRHYLYRKMSIDFGLKKLTSSYQSVQSLKYDVIQDQISDSENSTRSRSNVFRGLK